SWQEELMHRLRRR
ncbi:hypothetical protein A2U01_0107793, partial [Trifolium medium]|nr:hypothetical protein [Trifolium medium]